MEQNGHPNSSNSSNAHGLPGTKTGLSLFETRQKDGKKKNLPNLFAPLAWQTWPQNIKSAGCRVSFRRQ
jgi:hypothetical protein